MTGDTVSHDAWYDGIFDPALELLLLSPSLWFNSRPLPLPNVNKYTVYTHTLVRGGGYGVLGLRQINNCCKFP